MHYTFEDLARYDAKRITKTEAPTTAEEVFNSLELGQKIQALKHPDHEVIRRSPKRKVGTVYKKKSANGKYLAVVETEGGFETYNLEAVELMD